MNEVDDYHLFLRICQLANCPAMKHEKGFDVTIRMIKNVILFNDMKKWVLHRRVRQPAYTSIEKITTYRVYKF